VVDGMLEFTKYLNLDSNAKWTPLILEPEEDFAREHIHSNKITCLISPCSSQRYGNQYNRSWSINNFAELIKFLINLENLQVIITGGNSPPEQLYSKELDALFGNDILNLIGKTSIREMAALIKYSDFIISPDSGPAHIATIMGKPVIGLYAMSNPKRSGPYNSDEWLINKYDQALKVFMDKSPTEVKFGQKIKQPGAMDLIKTRDVIEKIELLIKRQS
jgi:heptosyltransferase I